MSALYRSLFCGEKEASPKVLAELAAMEKANAEKLAKMSDDEKVKMWEEMKRKQSI